MIYEYYENEIRTIFVGSVNKGIWVEPEPETDSLAVVRPAAERQLMPPANLLELRDKQENLK